MLLNRLRRNSKLYVKLLLGMTVFIAATIIATSSIYYLSYSRIMQTDANTADLESLRNMSQFVQGATDSAQSLSFQIYRNSTLAKLLYYYEPNEFDVQGALLELNNYLNSIAFIESIYVYNPQYERFYVVSRRGQAGILSAHELNDQDIIRVLDRFEEYKPFVPIPRRYKIAKDDAEPTGIYTYLCFDAINVDREITSAVIVNISAKWINKGIEAGSDQTSRQTFIMDDHKRMMSADQLKPMNEHSGIPAIASLIDEGTAYQIADVNGTKSLISYTSPDRFNWRYIRITPYQAITEKIAGVRTLSAQIAAGILVAGVLLAWIVSFVLYMPYRRIVKRVNDLETEKRETSYAIRQNMLRKLFQMQSFDPDILQSKLQRSGIHFDMRKPYRLLHIRIDSFQALKEQNGSDVQTYKYAIMNIGSEISSRHYAVETVDVDEDSVLMLLNAADAAESDRPEWLDAMMREIGHVCKEYFSLSLTMAASPVSADPFALHSLYKQVKEASRHRLFLGHGAIIHAAELATRSGSEYVYPAGLEKRMVEALMTGRAEDAKAYFAEIMKETRDFPVAVAESALSHVTITLTNVICEIQKNGAIALTTGTSLHMPDFKLHDTIEEITEDFYRLFDELIARIAEKRAGKQEDLIRSINEIIHARYADPNLSLNLIADELRLSTFYISRVYRQQTLNTIVDVINNVRMDKARTLLMEEARPIAEIAELTGYTNSSYFHRMFKKFNGVTPAEFRKANQA